MSAGSDVLGLERRGERADGLPVGVLEQGTLPTLDLEEPAQVLRVQLHLLFPVRAVAPRQLQVEAPEQPFGERQELERAERLAEKPLRESCPCGLARSGV